VRNVIVYFPWGGAGNLVKNIINLDTRFEFLDDQKFIGEYPTTESRYNFLLDYYKKPVDPTTWLPREWSIRARFHSRYYLNGNCVYWNPEKLLTYDVHGGWTEIDNILENRQLKIWDRVGVEKNIKQEQLSPWTLMDCAHIFLIPSDVPLVTRIYNSKNPTINQLEHEGDLAYRQEQAEIINTTMTNRLIDLARKLSNLGKVAYSYDAVGLYKTSDSIKDIVKQLGLNIPEEYIDTIHRVWLQSTQEVYYNYFNKELSI
jgi:hypothetical protein